MEIIAVVVAAVAEGEVVILETTAMLATTKGTTTVGDFTDGNIIM